MTVQHYFRFSFYNSGKHVHTHTITNQRDVAVPKVNEPFSLVWVDANGAKWDIWGEVKRVKIENVRNEMSDFTQVMALVDLSSSGKKLNGRQIKIGPAFTKDKATDWYSREDAVQVIGGKAYGEWVSQKELCCEENEMTHLDISDAPSPEELEIECNGEKIAILKYRI